MSFGARRCDDVARPGDGHVQFIERRRLIGRGPNRTLDLRDRQIGHAGRKAAAALYRPGIGLHQSLAVRVTERWRGGCTAIVDVRRTGIAIVAAVPVIVRPVPVFGSEIGSGCEDAAEEEGRSVGPEWAVIAGGPEQEGQRVAEQEWPEHRSGPAAPSVTPIIPTGPVEIVGPLVPRIVVSERVAVEPVAIEIVQAVEIVRGELVVRDLIVRQLRVSESVAASERVVVCCVLVCGQRVVVSRQRVVVRSEIVRSKPGCAKARRVTGESVRRESMSAKRVSGKGMAAESVSGEGMTAKRMTAKRMAAKMAAAEMGPTEVRTAAVPAATVPTATAATVSFR